MVELAEAPVAPAPDIDKYGGLVRVGETPEDALRRLEKTKAYTKTIGSDEGQRLLAAAHAQSKSGIPPAKAKATPSSLAEAAPKLVERLTTPTPAAAAQLVDIPLELLDIGENVRTDPGELEGLAASILEVGIQQPIRAVGPGPDGRYRAINGQRRILASLLAKLPTITAVVEASSDVDVPGARRSIAQLAENLQRKDMNPIEEAVALRDVLDADPKMTQEALADKLGRSRPWLSNTLRLLDTAPEVQALVRAEKLSTAHAKAIAGLDVDLQAEFTETAIRSKWTAADTERQVKWAKENADRTRQEIARADELAASAIATLEKVAQRDAATVAAGGYGLGERVAKLLRADGWAVIADKWTINTIKNAGSCGCKGVWKVEVPYGAGPPTVAPACNDEGHRKAREAERDKRWAADRRKADAERKVQIEAERGKTIRLGEILAADPTSPLTLRLAIYALATGESDEVIAQALGIDADDEVLDNVASEVDVTWSALEAMADGDLQSALAKVIAVALDDQWRVGQPVKDAIAALLAAHPQPAPEVPAAKPGKGKKAAPAS